MWRSQIKPGVEYALRERRRRGAPFQRIKIIEHIRGSKWKAEWIHPNPGLIHYVDSGNIVVPWKEHKAVLKEEENEDRIWEHNSRQGFSRDSPVARALQQIFESAGDEMAFSDGQGTLSCSSDA